MIIISLATITTTTTTVNMTRTRPQSMFISGATSSPTSIFQQQQQQQPNGHQAFYFPTTTAANTVVPAALTRDQQNLQFQRINFLIEDAKDFLNHFEVGAIAPSRRQTLVHKADRLVAKLEAIGSNQLISDLVRDKIRTLRFKLERRANNLCHLIDGQPEALQEESADEDEDEDDDEDEDEEEEYEEE